MEKKGSHFFQMIHNDIINDGRLELPKKIIEIFGAELGKAGLIEDPMGKIWPVELWKAEGDEIYFQTGWQGFMEYYSISVGYSLSFRYKGKSHFHVCIFDTTSFEIDYPCQTTDAEESHQSDHETTTKETETFESEFPICRIIISPTYILKTCNPKVPSAFAREFLSKAGDHGFLTLKDSSGRIWYVGYNIGNKSPTSTSTYYKCTLYDGWYKFVLDNDLKVGDACVFELVDKEKLEMKVNIFRVSPDVV